MKVLVFDTETTGLPVSRNSSINNVNEFPHIIQLSYILFDNESLKIEKIFDSIIKLPENILPSPESVQVHGITKEISEIYGMPIQIALDKFDKALKKAELIVGHNVFFDKKMMMVEAIRLNRNHYFHNFNEKKMEYCTMKYGKELCNIEAISKNGEKYIKYPKLSELHKSLFNYVPRGLHNSFADILICMRCYYKMTFDRDLIYLSRKFSTLWREVCVL